MQTSEQVPDAGRPEEAGVHAPRPGPGALQETGARWTEQVRAKADEIARLLPTVLRRTRGASDPDVLDALLSAMALLQRKPEAILEALDSYFDPERAPLALLVFMAYWVDLEALIAPRFAPGLAWVERPDFETLLAQGFPTGPGPLRALIVQAVPLLKQRGTIQGLERFLETATGMAGFAVTESQDRPFHVTVAYPAEAEPYKDFVRRLIEYQKPAYVTYYLVKGVPRAAREVPLTAVGLTEIEGIGETYAGMLGKAGIRTTRDLLERGATRAGRQAIARGTGIRPQLILEWVNHVDLLRIEGVGPEYADLLEESGVDTVPELARRDPEHLYQRLAAVNRDRNLVRRLPSPAAVRDWVEQAGQLPRTIYY
jgi:predicted flap endonuclease-1-like 5' DNA nuclease